MSYGNKEYQINAIVNGKFSIRIIVKDSNKVAFSKAQRKRKTVMVAKL